MSNPFAVASSSSSRKNLLRRWTSLSYLRFVHEHPLSFSESLRHKISKKALCKGCSKPISGSHYFCVQCDCLLHETCLFLPQKITYPGHNPHNPLAISSVPLVTSTTSSSIFSRYGENACHNCLQELKDMTYNCYTCNFKIDMSCASAAILPLTIDNYGGHEHSLHLLAKPMSFNCDACGNTHATRGFCYACTTCQLFVHEDCASLLNLVKHEAHAHPVAVKCFHQSSHSDFRASYCQICERDASMDWQVYFCQRCGFYAHVDCATFNARPASET